MKNILGIIGSPRKLGNSELCVKEISRNIRPAHQLNLIRLSDFQIASCRACYQCLFNDVPCPLTDGLYAVVEQIAAADALIVAAPAYFLAPHSLLKRFIDRGLSFYAYIDQLWGKPAVGVAVAGIDGREGHALLGVQNFAKMVMADLKESRVIYGALPGEVFLNDDNKAIACELGRSLFEPAKQKSTPHCNLCGGDTFRFLDHRTVRCMLCSNTGAFSMEGDKTILTISRGDHELILSKADALAHKKWLMGMKDRFIRDKQKLKDIVIDYRKEGTWVKP
ncbi:MAG: flavodoxin family protein [Desulfobacteraceae bacterium]|nr:flavodoxin family protein [Desulfobacteraceae bacterium]